MGGGCAFCVIRQLPFNSVLVSHGTPLQYESHCLLFLPVSQTSRAGKRASPCPWGSIAEGGRCLLGLLGPPCCTLGVSVSALPAKERTAVQRRSWLCLGTLRKDTLVSLPAPWHVPSEGAAANAAWQESRQAGWGVPGVSSRPPGCPCSTPAPSPPILFFITGLAG